MTQLEMELPIRFSEHEFHHPPTVDIAQYAWLMRSKLGVFGCFEYRWVYYQLTKSYIMYVRRIET